MGKKKKGKLGLVKFPCLDGPLFIGNFGGKYQTV
jgi:hypothetical protein